MFVAKLTEIPPPVEVLLTEIGAATTNPDEAMTGAVANGRNSVNVLTEIDLQWSKWLGPKILFILVATAPVIASSGLVVAAPISVSKTGAATINPDEAMTGAVAKWRNSVNVLTEIDL